MKRGLTISLRSDTDELIFSESGPLRIVSGGLRGFDYPETDVELAPSADGKSLYTKRAFISARKMSIRFEIGNSVSFRSIRDRVNRMMATGLELTLCTYFLGRRRVAAVFPAKAPEYIFDSLSDPVEVIIHLTAEKPYFTQGITLRTAVPVSKAVMSFPVSFFKGTGAVSSFSGPKIAAVIHNPGDTDCPVTAYLYAGGTVREPYIMLGEKKIRLMCELEAGDRVKIESGDGIHRISVNGSVSRDLDRRSRFFDLKPGDNTVVVNAAYGASTLRSYFEFMPRYLGI